MSDGWYGMGSPGINDWYLDRQGHGTFNGDDDQQDHGPDTWVDRITGPAVVRARKGAVAVPTRSPRSIREPFEPSSSASRPKRSQAALSPAALVKEVTKMQEGSARALSYAEVIEKLRVRGRSVSKGELQRAFSATRTQWGKPPRKAAATSQSGELIAPPAAKRPAPPRETTITARLVHEVRTLRTTRPDLGAEEITRRLQSSGRRVSEPDVRAILRLVRAPRPRLVDAPARQVTRPASVGSEPVGTTRPRDQALAREALRLQHSEPRTLSYDEIVRKLKKRGWHVTRADLRRAVRVAKIELAQQPPDQRDQLSRPHPRQSGPSSASRPSPPTQELPDQRDRLSRPHPRQSGSNSASRLSPTMQQPTRDPMLCDACGIHVSINGHCGCS